MDAINDKIAGTVREKIQIKLIEILSEKLHAKVEAVDMTL